MDVVDHIRCLAVDSLPGRLPVAITQIGDSVYVYVSREFDLETIAGALEEASNARQAHLAAVASRHA